VVPRRFPAGSPILAVFDVRPSRHMDRKLRHCRQLRRPCDHLSGCDREGGELGLSGLLEKCSSCAATKLGGLPSQARGWIEKAIVIVRDRDFGPGPSLERPLLRIHAAFDELLLENRKIGVSRARDSLVR